MNNARDYQQYVQVDEKLQSPHTPQDKREFVEALVEAIEVRRRLIKPKAFLVAKKQG